MYYELLGYVFNRTNNIFVLSFYKPFITVYFFVALRGSPFVFSLPCLLNRRKNNRWCWENVKEEESLFKMNLLFMWNVKKILRKENFLLTEAPTRFYFLLNFVRRRNVDTEFTTKEKTLSSWQLPYFVLSTILIEFPQLFSHSSFWHFEHSLHSTVSITLLDDGRVCKLRKI